MRGRLQRTNLCGSVARACIAGVTRLAPHAHLVFPRAGERRKASEASDFNCQPPSQFTTRKKAQMSPNIAANFRRVLAPALALSLAAAPLVFAPASAFAQARPTNLADLVETVADAVVNISATQTVEDKDVAGAPDLPKGTPFDDMFEQFFKNHGFNNAPLARAKNAVAGFGLRHRRERHRHHQQPRRRRRQRHPRHLHRRAQAEGQGARQGPQGRRRRAQGRERQAAEDRQVRRQRQARGSATG